MQHTCPECRNLLQARSRQYTPHPKLKFIRNGRSGSWHQAGGRRTEYRCMGCHSSLIRSAYQMEPGWRLGQLTLG